MRAHRWSVLVVSLAAVLLLGGLLVAQPARSAATYSVTVLSTGSENTTGEATLIADNGVILGKVGTTPAVWFPTDGVYGDPVELPLGTFSSGAPTAINESGVIVGSAKPAAVPPWYGGHAVAWVPVAGEYQLVDLTPDDDSYWGARAEAVNRAGTVVGSAATDRNLVVWTPTASGGYSAGTLLGGSGACQLWRPRINLSGTILGHDLVSGQCRATVWTPTKSGYETQVLPPLDLDKQTNGVAINDAGTVAGSISGTGQAGVWNPDGSGTYTYTALPKADQSAWNEYGTVVTRNGRIYGVANSYSTETGPVLKAAVWQPQVKGAGYVGSVLPTLGGVSALPASANDTGILVGGASDATRPYTSSEYFAVVWRPVGKSMTILQLPQLEGPSSTALSVNGSGAIVGWIGNTGYGAAKVPVLWAIL